MRCRRRLVLPSRGGYHRRLALGRAQAERAGVAALPSSARAGKLGGPSASGRQSRPRHRRTCSTNGGLEPPHQHRWKDAKHDRGETRTPDTAGAIIVLAANNRGPQCSFRTVMVQRHFWTRQEDGEPPQWLWRLSRIGRFAWWRWRSCRYISQRLCISPRCVVRSCCRATKAGAW